MADLQLVRSAHQCRVAALDGKAILYNTVLADPLVVDDSTLAFIDSFARPRRIEDALRATPDLAWPLAELIDKGLLCAPDEDLEARYVARRRDKSRRARRPAPSITLLVSAACNFACTYCYQRLAQPPSVDGGQLGGIPLVSRGDAGASMSIRVAHAAVDGLCQAADERGGDELRISFGGGEPLLNWPTIRETLEYAAGRVGSGTPIAWGLNTNASLVTDEIASKLAEHGVHVDSSLDGTAVLNNATRRTAGGRGTYSAIVRGLHLLVEYGVPLIGVSLTVTPQTLRDVDEHVLRSLASLGITNVAIEPDISGDFSDCWDELADLVLEMRTLGPGFGLEVSGSWERPYRMLLAAGAGHPQPSHYCGGVSGNAFLVQPSGQVVPCVGRMREPVSVLEDHWVSRVPSALATVSNERALGAIPYCKGCEIEGACQGGCYLVDEVAARLHAPRIISQRCSLLRLVTHRLLAELGSADNETVRPLPDPRARSGMATKTPC